MRGRRLLWGIPALLYALFVFWYTDFGGPLTEEEISAFMVQFDERGVSQEEAEFILDFMRQDTGRQFLMVDLMHMADNPPDVEGAAPGETAEQLMDRYMGYMWGPLLSRACHPIFMGTMAYEAMDIAGIEGAEIWDQAALMRYRSRRSLMEIIANAEQKDSHRYKIASLEKTIAVPVETVIYLSDPRFLLGIILLAIVALLDGRMARRQAGG